MKNETRTYHLSMQLPQDFIPQKTLTIAIDQGGRVRFDGEGEPFAYPAIVATMASKLCEALAYALTCGPTVERPTQPPITHREGSA